MNYAIMTDEGWQEIAGAFEDADGVSRPQNWLDLATDAERAELGIVEIAESEAPAFFTAMRIEDRDGTPLRVFDPGNDAQRRLHDRERVNARAAEAFAAGFAPAHEAFDGRKLQVRDSEDRTNWLTSQASYTAAVQAGHGAVEEARFRTMDNVTVVLSYANGLATLLDMAAWGAAIMARSWALKDAIDMGEPYDIEAEWP